MTRRFGLRSRVVILASGTTVVLFSLIGTIGFVAMASSMRSGVEGRVRDRLDAVEARLAQGDTFTRQIWPDGSDVQVVAPDDRSPQPDHTVQIVRPLRLAGQSLQLVGRADTTQLDANLRSIRRWLWASVAGGAALVAAFTWMAASRALAPVAAVTAQARSIYQARRGDSLPVPETDDEVTELVDTLNQMLARLRDHEERHRQFVSDASHELRTPLMVLLADAEFAAAHPAEADELPGQVLAQALRLRDLTDDLLTLATLDERVPLQALPAGEMLESDYGDHETVILGAPDGPASTVVADVSRSIRNLVANAHRHGRAVVVTLEAGAGGGVRIHVDDDGPGVAPAEAEAIFDRFHRGELARSRVSGGSGLGLAIVKAEVSAAGGTVSVATSPAGGARFTVEIPAVAAGAAGAAGGG